MKMFSIKTLFCSNFLQTKFGIYVLAYNYRYIISTDNNSIILWLCKRDQNINEISRLPMLDSNKRLSFGFDIPGHTALHLMGLSRTTSNLP